MPKNQAKDSKDNLRQKRERKRRIGVVQQKLLIMLLGGVSLGLTRSPKNYFRILQSMRKDFQNVPKSTIERSLNKLVQLGYLKVQDKGSGEFVIHLTKKGKQEAERHSLFETRINPPKKWDGLWRMVIFDIPERKRLARDSLRYHLKILNFVELQKSVFIQPFPCHKLIINIKKFYQLSNKQVRLVLVDSFEGEKTLKKKFNL